MAAAKTTGSAQRRTAAARASARERPPALLDALDVGRMIGTEPPPIPWLIEGMVVRGGLTILNGREGEGKSLVCLTLASAVAANGDGHISGFPVVPHPTKGKGWRVSVLDAENGPAEIHRRVRRIGLNAAATTYYAAEGMDMLKPAGMGAVEWVLKHDRPDLLVLDSWRSLWRGEESSSTQVTAVLDPLRNHARRYDCGIILIHHSTKEGGVYRGSGAVGASIDIGFGLDRINRRQRSLSCWKCRVAPEPPPWLLNLTGQGAIATGQLPEDDDERAPVMAGLAPDVLAVLDQARKDGPTAVVKLADLARAVGRNPKDRTVRRTLDQLFATGDVVKETGGWRRSDQK